MKIKSTKHIADIISKFNNLEVQEGEKLNIEFTNEEEQEFLECLMLLNKFKSKKSEFILGNYNDKNKLIRVKEIFYVESINNDVSCYLNDTTYKIDQKLYHIEESFNSCGFVRINKSTVVNVFKIECFYPSFNGRGICLMVNGDELDISRGYMKHFKQFIERM